MKAKKNKKVPKAQAGLLIGAGLSAIPQVMGYFEGQKAEREAKKQAADIKAMMPSMTAQEDYYNYYQKQAQAINEAKMQNQLDQTLAAGSKTLQSTGTRGVLGGVQGTVGSAAQAKFDIGQQRQDKLLGAYEKMIGAKQQDRAMLFNELQSARGSEVAGLQTKLGAAQGIADIFGSTAAALDPYRKKTKNTEDTEEEDTEDTEDKEAKNGAAIEKTPGEFSHKNNPIDIVRNGTKIAEMTGGEYIFNPKQMAAIKNMVAGEDKSQLHSYMKRLIKTFEKRAVK